MSEFAKYLADGAYHWDATSRFLGRHVAFTAGRYEAVTNLSLPWTGAKVLDIACGDARMAAMVVDAGARCVVGADLSQAGIRAGRARWSRESPRNSTQVSFTQANAVQLPFQRGSFDIVIACEIIEHVEDAERFVAEATRPLKNGGSLVVTTPYRLTERPLDPHHIREYFPGEIERLLQPHFDEVSIVLTHPAWVASLFTMPGPGRLFRHLVNLLSIAGWNPFLHWSVGNYPAQITALGRGRRDG